MDFKNLYLVKGKINYNGKEYNFKNLKLVRIKDLTLYYPVDIKVFTEFDFNKVYLFDEKHNEFIPDFDNEYAVSVKNTYLFSIYSPFPIISVVGTSENKEKVFLSVLSKSLFNYVIERNLLYTQRYTLLLHKYSFIRITTTADTYFSIIFYEPEIYIPNETINQNQIFDWDIIEL